MILHAMKSNPSDTATHSISTSTSAATAGCGEFPMTNRCVPDWLRKRVTCRKTELGKLLRSLVALIFLSSTDAWAAVLVSNIGQESVAGEGPSFAFGGYNGGPPATAVGVDFTTGSTSVMLDSVTLLMSDVRHGNPTGGVKVELYSSYAYSPNGMTGLLGTFTNAANPVTAGMYDFTGSGVTLAANTTYYLLASAVTPTGGGDFFEWTRTLSYAEDASSSTGWAIGSTYYLQSRDFPNWTTFSFNGVPQFALNTSVPEPSACALLGLSTAAMMLRRRRRSLEASGVAGIV